VYAAEVLVKHLYHAYTPGGGRPRRRGAQTAAGRPCRRAAIILLPPSSAMQTSSYEFLKRLLDAPGPSGFETAAARVWRAEAQGFADTRERGRRRQLGGHLGSGAPRVMLAGHVDEIGVMITHVDDEGFLYIDGIGGWDPQVLVGQRIRFLTRLGHVVGVVGKKPIHLMKPRGEGEGHQAAGPVGGRRRPRPGAGAGARHPGGRPRRGGLLRWWSWAAG
jgi:hypothetical protein